MAWQPPLTILELAAGPRRSCSIECMLPSTLSASRKMVVQKHFFPGEWAHSVTTQAQGGDTEGKPQTSASHHYRQSKAIKAAANITKLTPPIPITAALPAASGCRGQHWDYTDLELYCPPHSPQGN